MGETSKLEYTEPDKMERCFICSKFVLFEDLDYQLGDPICQGCLDTDITETLEELKKLRDQMIVLSVNKHRLATIRRIALTIRETSTDTTVGELITKLISHQKDLTRLIKERKV